MKLWVDDMRPAPEGYVWVKRVDTAKEIIEKMDNKVNQKFWGNIELIDIDHDAGDYAQYGGDYIKLLDWLEEAGRNYPIRIHSMNPYGAQRMREICEKNGWKEIV